MKFALIAVMGLGFAGLPLLGGCDREVAHEKHVDVKSDGTVKSDETTVTQRPDGTIVKEQEKRTDRP